MAEQNKFDRIHGINIILWFIFYFYKKVDGTEWKSGIDGIYNKKSLKSIFGMMIDIISSFVS